MIHGAFGANGVFVGTANSGTLFVSPAAAVPGPIAVLAFPA